MCYLENKVDRKLLDEVRQKLAKIDVRSVSMSQESIAEAMMGKKQWWTPFPKVRYTERPDAATACVMEGDIVVCGSPPWRRSWPCTSSTCGRRQTTSTFRR